MFALTGYRVGGVTADGRLMAEIEKAMTACRSALPALARKPRSTACAIFCLGTNQHEGLKRAPTCWASGLARSNRWRLVSIGAYFAYVEHPFAGQRSTDVSKKLADEENLLTIPGDMFGAARSVSFGSPSPT